MTSPPVAPLQQLSDPLRGSVADRYAQVTAKPLAALDKLTLASRQTIAQLGVERSSSRPSGTTQGAADTATVTLSSLDMQLLATDWEEKLTRDLDTGAPGLRPGGLPGSGFGFGKLAHTIVAFAETAIRGDPRRPHPLTTAAALYLVEECLRVAGFARAPAAELDSAATPSVADWILRALGSAIYSGGSDSAAAPAKWTAPDANVAASPAKPRHTPLRDTVCSYLSRPLRWVSEDAARKLRDEAVGKQHSLEGIARSSLLDRRTEIHRTEHVQLRSHFVAWHWLCVRDKAWASLLKLRAKKRHDNLALAKALHGWWIVTRASRGGCGHLDDEERLVVARGSALLHNSILPSTPVFLPPAAKRSIAFALPEGRSNSMSASMIGGGGSQSVTPKSASTTGPPAVSVDLEVPDDDSDSGMSTAEPSPRSRGNPSGMGDDGDDPVGGNKVAGQQQRLSALKSKLTVAKRRYRDAEGGVRQLRSERERQMNALNNAGECLSRAAATLLSGKGTDYAVKAVDVALNAQKLASGDLSAFVVTTLTGLDDLKPPVPCKGVHVILAWANFIIERVTGSHPRIGHVAAGFTDGLHYGDLVTAVFPDSDLPDRMRAVGSAAERMELLVRDVSRLVVGAHRMTHAAALTRGGSNRNSRRSSFSGTSAVSGATGTVSRKRSARSRRSSTGSRRSSLSPLDVVNVDSSDSDVESGRFGGTVLLDEGFRATELGAVGPILAAGLRPSDLAAGYEDAHLLLLYYLMRSYAATSVLDCYSADNAIEPWMDGVQAAERHVRAIELATASAKSWALLLEVVEDSVFSTLYRLAKGERAQALFTDVRNDSALSRFLVPMKAERVAKVQIGPDGLDATDNGVSPTQADSESGAEPPAPGVGKKGAKHHKGSSSPRGTAAATLGIGADSDDERDDTLGLPQPGQTDSWGLSEEELVYRRIERIHEQLAALLPDAELRYELLQTANLFGETIYGLFSHFAPSLPIMPPTGMETLVIECKLVELGVVSRGTGLQLSRQHGKQSPGQGLVPMEFTVALVHLSEMSAPALLSRGGQGNAGNVRAYNTPAARLDFFLCQFIQSKIRMSTADAVRRLLQSGKVRAAISVYSKILQTLFGSIAGAIAARASASKSTAQALLAGGGVEDLTLQMEDWVKLVRDLDFIDALTPVKFVQTIFVNSQDSFDATGDADMSYAEFEEAIVALGLARVPNPYMTIEVRLHVFFAERLLPMVRRKFPAVFLRVGAMGST
jgi:hypothetical protein